MEHLRLWADADCPFCNDSEIVGRNGAFPFMKSEGWWLPSGRATMNIGGYEYGRLHYVWRRAGRPIAPVSEGALFIQGVSPDWFQYEHTRNSCASLVALWLDGSSYAYEIDPELMKPRE